MEVCHLKHADLSKSRQQYKGRVVLRGDIAKDDEGYQAGFLRNAVRLRRKWPRPSFLIQFSDYAGCLDGQTMLCLLALRHVRRASLSQHTSARMPRMLDTTTSQQTANILGTYTRPICASETKPCNLYGHPFTRQTLNWHAEKLQLLLRTLETHVTEERSGLKNKQAKDPSLSTEGNQAKDPRTFEANS